MLVKNIKTLIICSIFPLLFCNSVYANTEIYLDDNKAYSISISPDSKTLAFSNLNSIKFLDINLEKEIYKFSPSIKEYILDNIYLDNDKYFLSLIDKKNNLILLEVNGSKVREIFKINKGNKALYSTKLSKDRKNIAVYDAYNNKIYIYNLNEKNPPISIEITINSVLEKFDFSEDNKSISIIEKYQSKAKEESKEDYEFKEKINSLVDSVVKLGNQIENENNSQDNFVKDYFFNLKNRIYSEIKNLYDSRTSDLNVFSEEIIFRYKSWNLTDKKLSSEKEVLKINPKYYNKIEFNDDLFSISKNNLVEVKNIKTNNSIKKLNSSFCSPEVKFSINNNILIIFESNEAQFLDLVKSNEIGYLRFNEYIQNIFFSQDLKHIFVTTNFINHSLHIMKFPEDLKNLNEILNEKKEEENDKIKYMLNVKNMQLIQKFLTTFAVVKGGVFPNTLKELQDFINSKIRNNNSFLFNKLKEMDLLKNPYSGKNSIAKSGVFDDYENYKETIESKGVIYYKPIKCTLNPEKKCMGYNLLYSNENSKIIKYFIAE